MHNEGIRKYLCENEIHLPAISSIPLLRGPECFSIPPARAAAYCDPISLEVLLCYHTYTVRPYYSNNNIIIIPHYHIRHSRSPPYSSVLASLLMHQGIATPLTYSYSHGNTVCATQFTAARLLACLGRYLHNNT
jgi:hypothetical protein